MPKNHEKYKYIEIAIPLGTKFQEALEQDALEHGLTLHQLGTLATLRLAEYYEHKEQGMQLVHVTPSNGTTRPPQKDEQVIGISGSIEELADAALDGLDPM